MPDAIDLRALTDRELADLDDEEFGEILESDERIPATEFEALYARRREGEKERKREAERERVRDLEHEIMLLKLRLRESQGERRIAIFWSVVGTALALFVAWSVWYAASGGY
jgi:hypothetical protein